MFHYSLFSSFCQMKNRKEAMRKYKNLQMLSLLFIDILPALDYHGGYEIID